MLSGIAHARYDVAMGHDDIQKAIVEALRTFSYVKRIILFGSRARGDYRPKSDFDIAVDCPNASTEEWVDLVESLDRIPTLLSIQLVRYNSSSSELQKRIQQEGVVLYEQKD